MKMKHLFQMTAASCLVLASLALPAKAAADPASCQLVRMAEPGWTDIAATTGLATVLFEALGYQTDTKFLSVAVIYSALSSGDIDVFLGYWHPTMEADFKPYGDAGSVELVRMNLKGAKYTLAVPKTLYDEGLKSFDDIAKFAERLEGTLHGIEPGNDGNRTILSILEQNAYNLGNFQLVESSESAMLSEVEARIGEGRPIVFLAWEPHPMNSRFEIAYLQGGNGFFGPNYGGAEVGTNVRKGYRQDCPNVARLLENLEFSLRMENEIMSKILDEGKQPTDAAREWLQANPAILETWLANVTHFDGSDGLDAVKASLSL